MGMGADQWNPKLWAALPEEARDELVGLLQDIERTCAWPEQIHLNGVGMNPRPTGEGDRPIPRTHGLYRTWSRLRKEVVTTWEKQKAGFWDAAAR
eukprot:5321543-Pyramimonas_sp.AAC.1